MGTFIQKQLGPFFNVCFVPKHTAANFQFAVCSFLRPIGYVSNRPCPLENNGMIFAKKFMLTRGANGRRYPTTPALPAALRQQSTPRPLRRNGAIPHKSPAQTPPHRAESRLLMRNFRPKEFLYVR